MSLKDIFRRRYEPKKSLKERIKILEKEVAELEKASFIPVEIGGEHSFFHSYEFVGVNCILQELIKDLGYDLVYRQEIQKTKCLKKKPLKK